MQSSFLYSFADGRPLGLPDATYFFAVPDPAGLPLGLPVESWDIDLLGNQIENLMHFFIEVHSYVTREVYEKAQHSATQPKWPTQPIWQSGF